MNDSPSPDLGFTYRRNRDGAVEVLRHEQVVSTLRGTEAQKFLDKIMACDSQQAQQLMARVTGNYKRGNERLARSHSRNRR